MPHVEPVERQSLEGLEGVFSTVEAAMGFLPNSMLTMAHMPQLTMSFAMLASVVFGADLKDLMAAYANQVPERGAAEDNLPPALVQLVAFAASVASGCRYCQAHTSHSAHRLGEDADKLANILAWETHSAYTDAERAAVALALAAAEVPNAVEASHFDALRNHFSERQIVQIVAVASLFGYLNRWNDTMATALEASPRSFATGALPSLGWNVGKHG